MKNPIMIAVLLLASSIASADTITLTDGRTFADAKIVSASPGRVCIRHSGGLVQIDKALLPPTLAAQHPADPLALAAEDTERREAAAAPQAQPSVTHIPHRSEPAAPPVEPAELVERATVQYAEAFFRDKYIDGRNDAITVSVSVTIDHTEQRPGWTDQWRAYGEAAFTEYRSSGTRGVHATSTQPGRVRKSIASGTYQKNSRRFEALVFAPTGKEPKVTEFTLR